MKIKYDKTFDIDMSDEVLTKKNRNWSQVDIDYYYKNGVVISKLLEMELPYIFSTLIRKNGAGFDFVDRKGHKYELKGFKNSCILYQSKDVGAGRAITADKLVEWRNKAKDMTYILSDTSNFPIVKVVFKKGSDLIDNFPEGKINKGKNDANRKILFG